MKRFFLSFPAVAVVAASIFVTPSAQAYNQHFWQVDSPDHEQTFAYGTEQNRVWAERGNDRHLAVLLLPVPPPSVAISGDFTLPRNGREYPREYDNFIFSFPGVKLGKDGHTFYYRASDGRSIPVASKHPGFLGIEQIRLLPNAYLSIDKPHGYLSLTLVVQDAPATADSE